MYMWDCVCEIWVDASQSAIHKFGGFPDCGSRMLADLLGDKEIYLQLKKDFVNDIHEQTSRDL